MIFDAQSYFKEICASTTGETLLRQSLHWEPTFNSGWDMALRPTNAAGIISPPVRSFVSPYRSVQGFALVGVRYKIQNWRGGRGTLENFSKDFFPLSKRVCAQRHMLLSSSQNEKPFDGHAARTKRHKKSLKQLPAGYTDLNEARGTRQYSRPWFRRRSSTSEQSFPTLLQYTLCHSVLFGEGNKIHLIHTCYPTTAEKHIELPLSTWPTQPTAIEAWAPSSKSH